MSSCCWLGSLQYGSDSDIIWGTVVSLARRADTGRINSSPQSAQLPVVDVQAGCATTIAIHTDDADGDVVKCRWAKSEASECGVCNGIPGAVINPVSGR